MLYTKTFELHRHKGKKKYSTCLKHHKYRRKIFVFYNTLLFHTFNLMTFKTSLKYYASQLLSVEVFTNLILFI